MDDTFTYFLSDGTRELHAEPPSSSGIVWIRGAYGTSGFPSPLNVRVGVPGVKVWMVIRWLEDAGGDAARAAASLGGAVDIEDVVAANSFYEENRDVIRERIDAELEHA